MVHEFHVIRCFKCQTFQVQQVKKVKKWSCKLCGEKQWLLKEFGRGSGADCRRHVQKLNAMRGAVMGKHDHQVWCLWEHMEEDKNDQISENHISRWSKYMDTPEDADPQEDNSQELNGLNMSDRKRKRSCTPEQSKCRVLNPGTLQDMTRSNSPLILKTTGLDRTNQNQSHSPSKKYNLPSLKTGPVSKWVRSLGFTCPVQEEGPSVHGITDHVCHDIERSQPLCVTSMFDSEENFSFDDDFLTNL